MRLLKTINKKFNDQYDHQKTLSSRNGLKLLINQENTMLMGNERPRRGLLSSGLGSEPRSKRRY